MNRIIKFTIIGILSIAPLIKYPVFYIDRTRVLIFEDGYAIENRIVNKSIDRRVKKEVNKQVDSKVNKNINK